MSTFAKKRIILFSDGTGNTMTKNRGSNVWKLYEAIDLSQSVHDDTKQIVFYDDGVGTDKFKPLKILGGAFGIGLKKNIIQLYVDLCRTYDYEDETNDEIFMFGFSRGAYTVRTLNGLIQCCGIIENAKSMTTEQLYKTAKKGYAAFRTQFKRASIVRSVKNPAADRKCNDFRKKYCIQRDIPIKFLGVWDTVEAVGLPFAEITSIWNQLVYPFKFPDLKLSPNVEKACQALAIDDERKTFHPILWDESTDADKKRIEQVWFAGMHSNVGGGYSRHGISLISLNWMMKKAKDLGLRYKEARELEYIQSANVHDKMHNSRAGLAAFYRYTPRNVQILCRKNEVTTKIHNSVYERILLSTGSYAPSNISPDLDNINSPISEKSWLIKARILTNTVFVAMCIFLIYKYHSLKNNEWLSSQSDPMCVPQWFYDISEKIFSYIPFGSSIHNNLLNYYYFNKVSLIIIIALFITLFIINKLIRHTQNKYYNHFWHDFKMKNISK